MHFSFVLFLAAINTFCLVTSHPLQDLAPRSSFTPINPKRPAETEGDLAAEVAHKRPTTGGTSESGDSASADESPTEYGSDTDSNTWKTFKDYRQTTKIKPIDTKSGPPMLLKNLIGLRKMDDIRTNDHTKYQCYGERIQFTVGTTVKYTNTLYVRGPQSSKSLTIEDKPPGYSLNEALKTCGIVTTNKEPKTTVVDNQRVGTGDTDQRRKVVVVKMAFEEGTCKEGNCFTCSEGKLREHLRENGFKAEVLDECFFTKNNKGGKVPYSKETSNKKAASKKKADKHAQPDDMDEGEIAEKGEILSNAFESVQSSDSESE